MRGVIVFVVLGLVWEGETAQYLNNRPYPTYSLESMPDTDFTCREKVLGGYYADPDTQCQMFHICVKVAGVGVQDFRFLCPNGTAFDQDHQICAEWDDVDCDATTLYYSSDNFDLYRLGSGFESKAVKYGEEEETFALQRADTGDARLNREHQSQSVNQQKAYNTASPFRRNKYQTQSRPESNEKEIFKGSSSSNFFNNRNSGKEVDDDEYDANVNANQDSNYEQKRKNNPKQIRKQYNQNYNEVQTQRPTRPTGFLNNFAGSSIETTPRTSSTSNSDGDFVTPSRGRSRHRQNNDRHYNNAENFRQQTQNNNVPQTPTFTISTPAPFKQTSQYYPTSPIPKQASTVKQTENYPSTIPRQKQTFQQRQTENYPSTVTQPKQTVSQQKQTYPQKETENYPSPFTKQQTNNYPTTPLANTRNTQLYDQSYDVPKVKQVKQSESVNQNFENKKQTTEVKQADTYPTTYSPRTKPAVFNTQANKDFPSTFSPRTNAAYTQISQQTTQQETQNTQQYNTQTTQQQRYTQQRNTQQYNNQPTTLQTQQYNNPTTIQQEPRNTQQYNTQTNTQQYSSQPTTLNQRNTQQYTQNTQQYNSQTTQQRNSQQQTTQFTNNQHQTTQYFNTQTTQNSSPRPSPFTQYTPTVPKVVTTTPVPRSNRFDETQYDDYDSKSTKSNEDEFLKTAHSTNIASSRNELVKSIKNNPSTTAKPFYESPRPFSLESTSRVTDLPRSSASSQSNTSSTNVAANNNQNSTRLPQKKDKNVSYDYAYYDNNPPNEPEYDVETDIQKSTTQQ